MKVFKINKCWYSFGKNICIEWMHNFNHEVPRIGHHFMKGHKYIYFWKHALAIHTDSKRGNH